MLFQAFFHRYFFNLKINLQTYKQIGKYKTKINGMQNFSSASMLLGKTPEKLNKLALKKA